VSSSNKDSSLDTTKEEDKDSSSSSPEHKLGVLRLAGSGLPGDDDGLTHLQDLHVPVRLVGCRRSRGNVSRGPGPFRGPGK